MFGGIEALGFQYLGSGGDLEVQWWRVGTRDSP